MPTLFGEYYEANRSVMLKLRRPREDSTVNFITAQMSNIWNKTDPLISKRTC